MDIASLNNICNNDHTTCALQVIMLIETLKKIRVENPLFPEP